MIDGLLSVVDTSELPKNGFLELRGFKSTKLDISSKNEILEDSTRGELIGVAVRALVGGSWGFSITSSLDVKYIRKASERAISMAKKLNSAMNSKGKGTIDSEYVNTGKNELKFDLSPQDVSIEEKINLVNNYSNLLKEYDSRIKSRRVQYVDTVQREYIVNSNGTKVTTDLGIFRVVSRVTSKEGGNIQNAIQSVASSSGLKKIYDWDLDEAARDLGKRAIRLLSAKSVPAGRRNVVMDQPLVGVYIHEAFGHAAEGDAITTRRSVLSDKLGKKVGSSDISVHDDPTLNGLRGSLVYDSEGTIAKRRTIVKDGNLVGFMNSLETAKKLGMEPNGAGRAQNFKHVSMVRMSNTYVENGDHSLEELIEEVRDGILLSNSYGGYVNPSTGEFFFSSQDGWLIENGELTSPIQNSGMSGKTLDVLNNTIAVGNDLEFSFQGTCGKPSPTGQQLIPVTGGGPHLAVAKISVGGQ